MDRLGWGYGVYCGVGGMVGRTGLISLLLIPPTQMFCQELLCSRIKYEAVFWFGEAVPFIWEEHIFEINALVLHRLDNLFGFCLFHAGIVSSLGDEHGYLDLIGLEKG